MSETTPAQMMPHDVSDLDMAFGGGDVLRDLMPKYADIPDEFKHGHGKWITFQQDWFYAGLRAHNLIPRDGVNVKQALRHLGAIQSSFDPKHEHKEAAVAYLASLWFTDESTMENK